MLILKSNVKFFEFPLSDADLEEIQKIFQRPNPYTSILNFHTGLFQINKSKLFRFLSLKEEQNYIIVRDENHFSDGDFFLLNGKLLVREHLILVGIYSIKNIEHGWTYIGVLQSKNIKWIDTT